MELSDYAQALGAAQRLVPSYDGQQINRLQMQGQQLQNRQAQQQIAQVDAQEQERRAFQSAFVDLGTAPSAEKMRMLGVRFPAMSKGINDAVSGMERGQRQQVVSDTSQIHAALNANRPDLARSLVQRHIDADKAAGKEPDPEDTALIGMIDSGDAKQISAAKGMLFATLASADPDSAAKVIGEYGGGAGTTKGQVVGRAIGHYDATGTWFTDYRDPDPVEYKSVGAGETLVEVGGNAGGGGRASSGGRADGSFDSFHKNFLGPTEGGYADRDGMSGAPVNFGVNQKANPDIDVKSLTPEAGKNILLNRYWKKSGADQLAPGLAEIQGDTAVNMGVDTAKRLLKQSGGDPERYLQLREARYRSIGGPDLRVWLNRNNALRKYVGLQDGAPVGGASGGARVVAQGAPKAGAQRMTPQQVQAEGLDPKIAYYRDANGVPQAVSGQSRPTRQALQLTEGQAKATGLLGTMVAAVSSLNTVRDYKPSQVALALNDLSNKNPIKGNLSQADRRVLNAQLAFANSILRLESGAAIGKDEAAAKAQTLFPMPGDGPEVQADKRAQREAALRSMRVGAGPGSESVAQGKPAGGGAPSQVVTVSTPAQASKLKPGTFYRAPDGKVRRR